MFRLQCSLKNWKKSRGRAHPSVGVPLLWKITHDISSLSPGSDFWHAPASRRITAFTCSNSWSLPAGAQYVWECVIASEKQMRQRLCRAEPSRAEPEPHRTQKCVMEVLLVHSDWGCRMASKRQPQWERSCKHPSAWGACLTIGLPSVHLKSLSNILSLSPIHW